MRMHSRSVVCMMQDAVLDLEHGPAARAQLALPPACLQGLTTEAQAHAAAAWAAVQQSSYFKTLTQHARALSVLPCVHPQHAQMMQAHHADGSSIVATWWPGDYLDPARRQQAAALITAQCSGEVWCDSDGRLVSVELLLPQPSTRPLRVLPRLGACGGQQVQHSQLAAAPADSAPHTHSLASASAISSSRRVQHASAACAGRTRFEGRDAAAAAAPSRRPALDAAGPLPPTLQLHHDLRHPSSTGAGSTTRSASTDGSFLHLPLPPTEVRQAQQQHAGAAGGAVGDATARVQAVSAGAGGGKPAAAPAAAPAQRKLQAQAIQEGPAAARLPAAAPVAGGGAGSSERNTQQEADQQKDRDEKVQLGTIAFDATNRPWASLQADGSRGLFLVQPAPASGAASHATRAAHDAANRRAVLAAGRRAARVDWQAAAQAAARRQQQGGTGVMGSSSAPSHAAAWRWPYVPPQASPQAALLAQGCEDDGPSSTAFAAGGSSFQAAWRRLLAVSLQRCPLPAAHELLLLPPAQRPAAAAALQGYLHPLAQGDTWGKAVAAWGAVPAGVQACLPAWTPEWYDDHSFPAPPPGTAPTGGACGATPQAGAAAGEVDPAHRGDGAVLGVRARPRSCCLPLPAAEAYAVACVAAATARRAAAARSPWPQRGGSVTRSAAASPDCACAEASCAACEGGLHPARLRRTSSALSRLSAMRQQSGGSESGAAAQLLRRHSADIATACLELRAAATSPSSNRPPVALQAAVLLQPAGSCSSLHSACDARSVGGAAAAADTSVCWAAEAARARRRRPGTAPAALAPGPRSAATEQRGAPAYVADVSGWCGMANNSYVRARMTREQRAHWDGEVRAKARAMEVAWRELQAAERDVQGRMEQQVRDWQEAELAAAAAGGSGAAAQRLRLLRAARARAQARDQAARADSKGGSSSSSSSSSCSVQGARRQARAASSMGGAGLAWAWQWVKRVVVGGGDSSSSSGVGVAPLAEEV